MRFANPYRTFVPSVKDTDKEGSDKKIFNVTSALKELIKNSKDKKIILISGPNCEMCKQIYPQNSHTLEGPEGEILHGNPCTINIGDTSIAISNSAFNNNAEIISLEKPSSLTRRFEQISQAILATNCFYPMCPASLSHPVHYPSLLEKKVGQPDILILPTRAELCVVNIGGTYCINPGFVQLGYMCHIKTEKGASIVTYECI